MRCSRARSGWLLQTCADGARAHGPRHTRGLVRDSGGVVLGLIGGEGSILAVPLLVYGVGVPSTHVAIGTSAVAVALSALSSLITRARAGNVRWPCALVFAACGMVGAGLGSTIGKSFDGRWLLFLFGLLMIVIALLMLREPHGRINRLAHLDPDHFLSNFKSPQSASETCPRVATPGCSGPAATRLSCRLRS
ncbi:sulfite exporter TauE/SafE family protein [Nitrobacter sp.]|uniref:sulfite exporter TauE/SafE family protein n=1 Tax=unclassified Nitrobacter TaxID=2620411 RepID=UPI003220796B